MMLSDLQVADLMERYEIPRAYRRWFATFIRTGRRTKGLARAMRAAARWMPLDDNPFLLCMLAASLQWRDNADAGIVGWTSSGQPLRIAA